MIDLFMPFRAFLKLNDVSIDNYVFRLHYKITVAMLLVFTLLVTSKQFFGEPIHCMGDSEKHKDVVNSYCWIFGTYTVENQLTGVVGKDMAHYGVGPSTHQNEEIHHIYYQWVCFVLLLQAALFYFPHSMWKIWEGGRLKLLMSDLVCPMVPDNWTDDRRKQLIRYLCDTNLYKHNFYAFRFAFCELLNLGNVFAQIFFLDLFFGGQFRTYGAAVAAFQNHISNDTADPMARLFPKVTKCEFRYYGSSGTIQSINLLCVLPLNIVNEKIFVVLWFWLILLALLSILATAYRLLIYALPSFRTFLLLGQVRFVPRYYVANIVRNFNVGDWFILNQLGKNMNPVIFKDLLLEIGSDMDQKIMQDI